jgi:nucleoside-diphosphate-sugar epimerase
MRVLVTGGAGYIGQVLVPDLVRQGHQVTVFDALWFGSDGLDPLVGPSLDIVQGDIRDGDAVRRVLDRGFDAVVHLAAMSNDPTSDLDPDLTRLVNREAMEDVFVASKAAGVARLVYASSASVYGIKDTHDVTEDLELNPITLYARYKAEGEEVLAGLVDDRFAAVSVRAATVCGYSPRLRLDLTINILTAAAVRTGRIKVFGGTQMRPNIHVADLADVYGVLLTAPRDQIQGKAFNVSTRNASVLELAELVRDTVDPAVAIDIVDTFDHRSYHLSAARLERELGYTPKRSLEEAVRGVRDALLDGRVPEPDHPKHRNIAWMNSNPELWRR